jgi:hypothetical protein
MEKRGDILNQMAIISDLLENINLNANKKIVKFSVNREEFGKIYTLITHKTIDKGSKVNNEFEIIIGDVTFVFSMYNA